MHKVKELLGTLLLMVGAVIISASVTFYMTSNYYHTVIDKSGVILYSPVIDGKKEISL